MPRPQSSDEIAFEHSLLVAAAELFTQDGCDQVSGEQLAAHCQRRGIVSSHVVDNPRILLVAIFRHVWKLIHEETKVILSEAKDPRDAITDLFMNIFDKLIVKEGVLGRCIIIESHRYDREKIQACFMIPEFLGFLGSVHDYVDGQVRAGNLLPVNASAVVELFLSIQDGMMFAWTMEADFGYPSKFRIAEFETVTRMLVSTLFLPSTEQSREYYDSVASAYDFLYTDGISLAENAIVGDMVSASVTSETSVLDLGCGTGLGLELLARRVKSISNYVGIDISPEMVRVAKQRFVTVDNAMFMVMNIEDMSFFKSGSFDFCMSLFGSFSHVINPGTAVAEIHRVLKPGGSIFFMLYSRLSWKNYFEALVKLDPSRLAEVRPYEIRKTSGSIFADARFYTRKSVRDIFSMFDDIKIYGLNCWLELPFAKSRFADPSQAANARGFLETEMRKLREKPHRCHSLIVQARKHV